MNGFEVYSQVLMSKKNWESGGLVKTTEGLFAKENTRVTNIKTEIFNNGRKYMAPEGLEIIPIYKKSISVNNCDQGNNICKPSFLKSRFLKVILPSDSNETVQNWFSSEKYFNLDNSFEKNLGLEDKQFTWTAPRIKIRPEHSSTFNCETKYPKRTQKGKKDLTNFKDQHVLLAAFGLISNSKISQANLKLFIGEKSSGRYYCKLCESEADSKETIGEHINCHHSSSKNLEHSIKCPFCIYKNTNKSKLSSHVVSHSVVSLFHCPTCDFETSTKEMLKKHIITHLELKSYKCAECSFVCDEEYKLNLHSLKEHGVEMNGLEFCNVPVINKSTLHVKYSYEKLQKCDTSIFTGNSVHKLQKSSSKSDKSFSCPMCSFKSKFSLEIRKHIKTHTVENKFHCRDCSFSTKSKSTLHKHALKHNGKSPYQCDKCSYGTSHICDFRSHMNNHNNIRDFKCQFCDYAGTCNINLKRHMLVHSLEKPFKCSKCDYASKEKSKLKRHMKVHNNMLPNKCHTCDFKNYHNSNFKRHLLSHKAQQEFICAHCGLVCFSRSNIIEHLKSHDISGNRLSGN